MGVILKLLGKWKVMLELSQKFIRNLKYIWTREKLKLSPAGLVGSWVSWNVADLETSNAFSIILLYSILHKNKLIDVESIIYLSYWYFSIRFASTNKNFGLFRNLSGTWRCYQTLSLQELRSVLTIQWFISYNNLENKARALLTAPSRYFKIGLYNL